MLYQMQSIMHAFPHKMLHWHSTKPDDMYNVYIMPFQTAVEAYHLGNNQLGHSLQITGLQRMYSVWYWSMKTSFNL